MSEITKPESNAAGDTNPAAIMQMMQAFQVSAVVFAALELDLFRNVGDGAELETIANRIESPARTTRILLHALSSIGLIKKDGSQYRLTPIADAHLVPGKPMYVGDFAGIMGDPEMWSSMRTLSKAVRTGGTLRSEHAETPEHRFWERFAHSSGSIAGPASHTLCELVQGWLPAKKPARILDVACGSGLYGFALLKRFPNVELSSLDWPNVLRVTREWAQRLGIEKVKYIEGNLFEVDWQGPQDLIVLSHVLHHFDPNTCIQLVKKAHTALAPGGKIAIQEFVADEDGIDPASNLFAIVMLSWTRKGQAYTLTEYREILEKAGFGSPTVHPSAGMPTQFLIAERK